MESESKEVRSFSINQDFYNRELKATIESKFVPTYCIVFSTVLPFQLPLKDGTYFHLVFNDKASVYYFNKFGYMQTQPIYEKDEGIPKAVMRTRVELACFTTEDLNEVDTQRAFEYSSHDSCRLKVDLCDEVAEDILKMLQSKYPQFKIDEREWLMRCPLYERGA